MVLVAVCEPCLQKGCSPQKPFSLTPSCDLSHSSSSELSLSSFYSWRLKTGSPAIPDLDLLSEPFKAAEKLSNSPCSPLDFSFLCILVSYCGACEIWIRAEPLATWSPGGAVGSQNLHPCCPPQLRQLLNWQLEKGNRYSPVAKEPFIATLQALKWVCML